jgi:hypothetical protein
MDISIAKKKLFTGNELIYRPHDLPAWASIATSNATLFTTVGASPNDSIGNSGVGYIVYLNTQSAAGYISHGSVVGMNLILGGGSSNISGKIQFSAIVSYVGTVSADVTHVHGLVSDRTVNNPNGAYFTLTNSGRWKCVLKTAAATITVQTDVSPRSFINNNPMFLDIVIEGNKVEYYIDENLVATINPADLGSLGMNITAFPACGAIHLVTLATIHRLYFGGMVVKIK